MTRKEKQRNSTNYWFGAVVGAAATSAVYAFSDGVVFGYLAGAITGCVAGCALVILGMTIYGYKCAHATSLTIWNRLPEKLNVQVNAKIMEEGYNSEWWRDGGDRPDYADDDSSGDPRDGGG